MQNKIWNSAIKPRYCCWVLTYKCMFKCKMCYIWETDNFLLEPTLQEKKDFISSLVGFVDDDFEFHLSGGEPLLNKDIYEVISHIKKYKYRSNMVTNGWLVDEQVLDKLVSAGLSNLTFSLDGMRARTHDYLRGQDGSYHKIMQAINIAKKKYPEFPVSLLTLINAHNLDEIIPLVDFVEQRSDIDMISFQVITQPFSRAVDKQWYKKEDGAVLWPKNREEVESILDELYERKKNGAKIGNRENHFLAFKRYFQNPNKFLKKIKCTMGDYEFHIDPYGKVFFCCFIDDIGNIKNASLPDLWQAPETKQIREKVYACTKNCHIMINCFFEDEICSLKDKFLNIFKG